MIGMRLLIVEDERHLVQVLRRVLMGNGYEVDAAYDGHQGLEDAIKTSYDVIILDLMLPGMDGLEICRQLRGRGIETPVLMLTAKSEVEDRIQGLTVGADDYLTKPFAMGELLARVHALIRRRSKNTASAAHELRIGDLTLDLLRHEAYRNNHAIELTAKEFALLEFLMRHPGQVLTRSQITAHVWESDLESLSNVVDNYIYYLREKIDRPFSHPMIKTVRGVGYRIEA
jgi:DNA-binding response OmpR family regulator